jgi:hypothetical protein
MTRALSLIHAVRICPYFLILLLTACASDIVSVTGGNDSLTQFGTQSETAATVSVTGSVTRIVVAYNDDTNLLNLIQYTDMNRVVPLGASLMGWSYSNDGGSTWFYGGTLSPPTDWAVLWGDPSIATSKTKPNVVFMVNLAVPMAKFTGPISGSLRDYIGGACIAKSIDGGQTFEIWRCVTNNNHAYDGSSIVFSSTGEVFAAFFNVDTSQVDVYRAPDENGEFELIAPPFPQRYMGGHPRLRTAPDGSLYVAAQAVANPGQISGYVYMNRFVNGSWAIGYGTQVSSPSAFFQTIYIATVVAGGGLSLQTGPQISFDIGTPSEGGEDAVRVVYQGKSATTGQLYLKVAVCTLDLLACYDALSTEGAAGPGNSLIDFYNGEVVAWPGDANTPATWQMTWAFHYGDSDKVTVSRSTLGYYNGTPLLLPVDIIKNTPVCSDFRGYWGDYDAMLRVGGGNPVWIRFLSDSSKGCTKRWMYTSDSHHIQLVRY